ncbi:hypothetical protein ANN_14880 [Periplaneta americana]|uniref:Uncharacterized protein n=1 Tax=Periplaneta americana TaxID=6978 RepID=A0ABQ8SXL3_PERAM|nr:hypothetical protein ANN_14880 [Periplaneta americana]
MAGLCEGGNEPPGSLKKPISQWIGRAGPTPWPARSPDMNPLDFYLRGRLKSLVYASAAPNVEVLQQRIEHACGIVRDEVNGLCNIQRSLRRRAQRNINTFRERERGEGKNTLDVEKAASIPKDKSALPVTTTMAPLPSSRHISVTFQNIIEYLESSSLQLKDVIGVIYSVLQKQVSGPVDEAVTLKLKKGPGRSGVNGARRGNVLAAGSISLTWPPYWRWSAQWKLRARHMHRKVVPLCTCAIYYA